MRRLLDLMEWPVAAAMVLMISLSAQAQSQEEETVDAPPAAVAQPNNATEKAPSYWIGILGGEVSPELRSHLGLQGAGVLVREVVPDSPAAQAGLEQFDVLLTANGKAATDMGVLAAEVRKVGGQEDGKIVLDLLRTGAHQQLTLVPAVRPETPRVNGQLVLGNKMAFPLAPNAEGQIGIGAKEQPFRFRLFGPGVTIKEGPNGVNVNATGVRVTTNNGQTHVSVTHNGQTWEVDSADPESLEQLPPELRPMVEGVLKNPGAEGVDLDINVGDLMPQIQGMLEGLGERRAERLEPNQRRLRRQLERMERQLEAMRRQIEGDAAEVQAAADGAGVAPAFKPPAPPATELEIPAVEE